MDTKIMLQDTVDKLLFGALDEKRAHIVKHATAVFLKGAKSDKEMQGFNDWFVHDYRDENNNSIVKLYMQENTPDADEKLILKSIEESVYSAFDRMPINDKIVLKDKFTKKDYLIKEEFETGNVMIARIYKVGNAHMLLDLPEYLPETYNQTLIKGVMEKYNEYCRVFMPIQMEEFMKQHSQVLYRFLSIIDDTAAEYTLDDEDYTVYQSTYVVKDSKTVYEAMKENEKFEIALDDEAGTVVKLQTADGEGIICEIVLADDKLELECLTSDELQYSKDVIEEFLGEYIAHLRDEILNIDDLIGE